MKLANSLLNTNELLMDNNLYVKISKKYRIKFYKLYIYVSLKIGIENWIFKFNFLKSLFEKIMNNEKIIFRWKKFIRYFLLIFI